MDLSDQCGYSVSVAVDENTIVLNDSIKDTCIGRYRFTFAHEVAHLILDMVYHLNYKVKYRSNPRVIKSRIDIISPFDNTGDYSRFCKIAAFFGVSREALCIRLQQAGMLGKYYSYQHQCKLDVFPVA